MKRALIVAATVVAFLGFAGRSDALGVCEMPPIDAGLVSIDGEPYTTQVTSDRGAIVHEDMVPIWSQFVDSLTAANEQSWISNAEVRFYTLTGGTIRLDDSDGWVFHVFDGAGVVKMPEDGTATGTVIAPEAVVDFDKPYSVLDGAIVAKRITASGTGGGRVTGQVGKASLICEEAIEITPVGNITPEIASEAPQSPPNSLATTGANAGPGYVLIAASVVLGSALLAVSRVTESRDARRRPALLVVPVATDRLAERRRLPVLRRRHLHDRAQQRPDREGANRLSSLPGDRPMPGVCAEPAVPVRGVGRIDWPATEG